MNNANKCPKCGKYIIGTYCYKCKCDITITYNSNIFDIFGDIFKEETKDNERKR